MYDEYCCMFVNLDVCNGLADAREYALHYSVRGRQQLQQLAHAP